MINIFLLIGCISIKHMKKYDDKMNLAATISVYFCFIEYEIRSTFRFYTHEILSSFSIQSCDLMYQSEHSNFLSTWCSYRMQLVQFAEQVSVAVSLSFWDWYQDRYFSSILISVMLHPFTYLLFSIVLLYTYPFRFLLLKKERGSYISLRLLCTSYSMSSTEV